MNRVRSGMERTVAPALLVASVSLGLPGCATEGWVKNYVAAQNAPIESRLQQVIDVQGKLTPVDSIVLRYRTDQFKLQPGHAKALDGVKETLANNPAYTVHVIGEADKPGAESYNEVLSRRRAAQVQRYLAANNGNGEMLHRISAIGAGDELATARGPDPEHRQVTVAIFKPSME